MIQILEEVKKILGGKSKGQQVALATGIAGTLGGYAGHKGNRNYLASIHQRIGKAYHRDGGANAPDLKKHVVAATNADKDHYLDTGIGGLKGAATGAIIAGGIHAFRKRKFNQQQEKEKYNQRKTENRQNNFNAAKSQNNQRQINQNR